MDSSDAQIINSVSSNGVDDPSKFVAANGVVLKIKRVPAFVVEEALSKVRDPLPPKVYIEERGREEDNPADPAYNQQLEDNQRRRANLTLQIMLGMGTEILHVPDDLYMVEDTQWSDDLKEFAELEVPATGLARRIAWLKLYALTLDETLEAMNKVSTFNGRVKEVDVAQASDSFRTDEGGSPSEAVSTNSEN